MPRREIIIYIEGEGGGGKPSKRRFNDGEFRKSWKAFLQPLADVAAENGIASFRCIPGRGGTTTANTFATPLPNDKEALRILLIDSEGPVSDVHKPWDALAMTKPDWADDQHCYLIVQCLESWLLADVESLAKHYDKPKKCFKSTSLKSWPDIEKVPKQTVQDALRKATEGCSNQYSHADGNQLIAIVRRESLMPLSSVARLFEGLAEKIRQYANA